ncbi:hypothetical protein H0I76_18735 [Limibaculum sp. M0105]|uniref:Uncharacterized protein n=1 Tax=Thermohalobaculum xanthum TaxID=2753746 RepID=A0A8J7MBH1_9RHOB|nr:hypothetical protein [Thermohalobaculum xanthum]MBK0401238.1 hypothetical protein [Thermohalobaculum xanthum]
MIIRLHAASAALLLLSSTAWAGESEIESAMSAGPSSLASKATIQTWGGEVLREGSNGWVCLPDVPDDGGPNPWCADKAWLNVIAALGKGEKPTYDKLGIAYMLAGDAAISNLRPDGKKEEGDWVEGVGAHLMIIVPDQSLFDNISTDPKNGGPWVMWPGTPYAHVMIPIDPYPPQ